MTQPGSTMSPSALPPPGRYRIDPSRSTVRADVRAMFGIITVHGTFRVRGGEAFVAADPGESTVRASIDAGSYASGLAARDRDVVSATLLDAAAYPEISFTAEGAQAEGPGWVMHGSVTAHGQATPADVHVSAARMEHGSALFQAVAQLDRADFGITRKKGLVGRTVRLTIDAACSPA